MTEMVEIEIVLDDKYTDPKVKVYTKSRTKQVEDILYAIENVSVNGFPPITVQSEKTQKLISQRDIYRIRTEGREVFLDTENESFHVRGPMARLENELDRERFFRISQSEIINLYKVDQFDYNMKGTVGVTLDNGVKTWVARRCVKPLSDRLKQGFLG